jgi:hypothetical protein
MWKFMETNPIYDALGLAAIVGVVYLLLNLLVLFL